MFLTELLLAHGANVNQRDLSGNTPLLYAPRLWMRLASCFTCEACHFYRQHGKGVQLCAQLLFHKADPHFRVKDGRPGPVVLKSCVPRKAGGQERPGAHGEGVPGAQHGRERAAADEGHAAAGAGRLSASVDLSGMACLCPGGMHGSHHEDVGVDQVPACEQEALPGVRLKASRPSSGGRCPPNGTILITP